MSRWLAHLPLVLLLTTLAACQGSPRPRGLPVTNGAGTPAAAPLGQRTAPSPPPALGAWHDVGPLVVARESHTATLLPNGQVLIAGGAVRGPRSQPSAELYDPVARTFRPTGSMTVWREHHTATLLPGGRVLVTGGIVRFAPGTTVEWTATAELYDPLTGTWAPTAPMHVPRATHTATLLPDGRVLVVGGTRPAAGPAETAFAELYDPVSGTWALTGKLETGYRRGHSAILLPDGRVVLVGGASGVDGHVRMTELYDPATNTWQPGASARLIHVAWDALLTSGRVLAVGTLTEDVDPAGPVGAEVYDPRTDSWAATGPLQVLTRSTYTATRLQDGRVLVVGGGNGGSAALYDPATNGWGPASSPGTARFDETATLLKDGTVLVVGGGTACPLPCSVLASAELYTP